VAIAPDGDGWVVSFRDIPEALTGGSTKEQAREMAEDALLTAMDFYIEDKRTIPLPSDLRNDEEYIELSVGQAAKVLLLNEMLAQKVRPAELATKLKTSPQNVNRLVNLKHQSKIDGIEDAFRALHRSIKLSIA
jgi:antitoxin HicB